MYGQKKGWWENNTYDIKRIKTEGHIIGNINT